MSSNACGGMNKKFLTLMATHGYITEKCQARILVLKSSSLGYVGNFFFLTMRNANFFFLTKQKSLVVLLSNNLNTSLYWDRQPFLPFQDLPFVLLLTCLLFVYMVQIHSSYFHTPSRPTKWMTRVFWQFTLPICWCSLLYNWRQKVAHHIVK